MAVKTPQLRFSWANSYFVKKKCCHYTRRKSLTNQDGDFGKKFQDTWGNPFNLKAICWNPFWSGSLDPKIKDLVPEMCTEADQPCNKHGQNRCGVVEMNPFSTQICPTSPCTFSVITRCPLPCGDLHCCHQTALFMGTHPFGGMPSLVTGKSCSCSQWSVFSCPGKTPLLPCQCFFIDKGTSAWQGRGGGQHNTARPG